MLIQRLADELQIRVYDGGAERGATAEAVRFNGVAHGIRMHTQLLSDGADFPMLGKKVAANLSASFWIDHRFYHADRGIRGNGSTQ